MSDLNLTPLLRKRFAPYPRKRGRYNSSELFRISRGYITPEQWITPRPWGLPAMLGMWNGNLVHDYVQRLLPQECNEIKVVHRHQITTTEAIQVVAKADHLPKHVNEIWEFKTSKKEYNKSTKEHEYQAKIYCTIHKRPIGKIYQPIQNENGLFLKLIGTVNRDDNWFREQMKILEAFHAETEKLWEAGIGELEGFI